MRIGSIKSCYLFNYLLISHTLPFQFTYLLNPTSKVNY